MSKVKFKLNLQGLNELMKGPEIQAILNEKGQEVASRAAAAKEGAEYRVITKPLNWIAVCNVSADNEEAIHDVYENNTLLKSL